MESEWALAVPASLAAQAVAAEEAGHTVVFAGWDGQIRGVLVVGDTIKPTSAAAITRLRGMALRPVLLTGDNERAARVVAATVGIGEVIAGVLPAGKVDAVKKLQDAGRVVAMAGDGVNDAAALAQADLGLAMGTGTDAAIEAADLTLICGDVLAVPDAIALSRRTLATIKGNLFWAFGYNAAAIPLAALGSSTRSSPLPRWRSAPCSSCPTACACGASGPCRPARAAPADRQRPTVAQSPPRARRTSSSRLELPSRNRMSATSPACGPV